MIDKESQKLLDSLPDDQKQIAIDRLEKCLKKSLANEQRSLFREFDLEQPLQELYALPELEVVARIITIPAELDEREQQEMISQEAVLYLPFPVDEADIDSVKLGKWVDEDGIEKIQVLLLGSRKNTLVESESDDAPQTPLVKKLWEIRQRAIASGMQLLDEAEIERELAERRGGYRES